MDLIAVHPDELTLVSNIRIATADDDLVASVRDHGLIEPISAYRGLDGALVVKHGHRRTLAARAAGLDTVPVVVSDSPADDDNGKAELMTAQWAENQQRRGLTTREQADAIAQIAAFGVSPSQIAKRLGVSREVVDAATAMPTTETLDTYELTIIQAAVVAEFEGDDEAVERLVEAAGDGQFDHEVARIRQERVIAQAVAAKRDELMEQGVDVLPGRPPYSDRGEWVDYLRTADGERVELDPADPGEHVQAYIDAQFDTVNKETGKRVSPWLICEDDEAEGKSNMTPRSKCEERLVVEVRWYCSKPAARGWTTPGGRTPASAMTDEEREAERAARRDVVVANKAWVAAEGVRKGWLRDFCTRKTAPKGTAAFVTETLLKRSHLIDHRVYSEAINYVDTKAPDSFADAKATMTTLALVLIAHEINTCKEDWRSKDRATAAYLRLLEELGYALSPVERRVCGDEVATDDL